MSTFKWIVTAKWYAYFVAMLEIDWMDGYSLFSMSILYESWYGWLFTHVSLWLNTGLFISDTIFSCLGTIEYLQVVI
jgi:hypothetical protein